MSSDGFHTRVSPQTSAIAAFHDHTATGKLKAVMTPTTPSGCHVSISRCPGRSEAMVLPYSWRDSPTANSQMSIISCTSPRASEVIFPASMVTSAASSSLCSTSSSPSRATSAPRTGAGVVRHVVNACAASAMAASACSGVVSATVNSTSPVMGVLACTPWAPGSPSSAREPTACSASRARVAKGFNSWKAGWSL